jgi:hypothetical protein
LKLNSLTSAQRDALTASNGMVIYNSTTNKVQQYIGGAWADVASGSGTLAHWTESNGTYSGKEFTKWTPSSASANVTTVLQPKGTGAIQAQQSDGTAAGGNNRGSLATDFQRNRDTADQVASGESSFAAGERNKASGHHSVAFGFYTSAAGDGAMAIGSWSQALGDGSFVMGDGGSASLAGAFVVAGPGNFPNPSGSTDPAQVSQMCRRAVTFDSTQTELTGDRLVLPNFGTWAFSILLVARRVDGNNIESAAHKFEGAIRRFGLANTTAIVGTVTKTVLAEDTAAWDADVDADTTNGALRILVTGQAAKTIRWVARIELAEVSGYL